ncbi:hypothetical protein D3C86_1608470 [compost metagenome]
MRACTFGHHQPVPAVEERGLTIQLIQDAFAVGLRLMGDSTQEPVHVDAFKLLIIRCIIIRWGNPSRSGQNGILLSGERCQWGY